MTIQEIFDKVATHLLTQNKKSMTMIDGKLDCAYRGDCGLKCAAGCLIPDEIYRPEFEGKKFSFLFGKEKDKLNIGFDSEQLRLVSQLQYIHDWTTVEGWRDSLYSLCSLFNLSNEVLKCSPLKTLSPQE